MKKKTDSNRYLKGMTVRARFVLFTIMLVSTFILIGFIVYSGYRQVKKMERLQEQINNLRFAGSGMKISQNELFKEIQVNIEGLTTGEFESTKHLMQQYTLGKQNLNILRESTILDNAIESEVFDSLEFQFNTFRNNYDTIVSMLMLKGYREHGLLSELESHMFDLDNSFLISDDEFLTNLLLLIRTNERNYFLLQDLQYYNLVLGDAAQLMDLLKQAEKEEEILVQPTLSDILGEYINIFEQIVTLDTELGFHEKEGAIDKQETLDEVLDRTLQSVVYQFTTYKDKPLFRFFGLFIAILLLLLIVTLISVRIINRNISHSLAMINHSFAILARGKLPDDIDVPEKGTEFARVLRSLKKVIAGLQSTIAFAKEIEQGNYHSDYEVLSEEDELGNALIEMRENLLHAEEENKKNQAEEKQLSYINAGTAKFAEILNHTYSNTEDFAYAVISNLVKYLNANQGGFFIVNDQDENDCHLEMKSAFAYDRRKFLERRIELGEGFVGTSVMEKTMVYRTEIPKDYITITSGLGDATPRVLLIAPLVMEDEIFGALEIAAFTKFEPYQLDFIKKISDTVATTISSVKSREKTEQLLRQSQEQAEHIMEAEEEMRQNLEEMEATQEEAARREKQLEKELEDAQTKIKTLEEKPGEATKEA